MRALITLASVTLLMLLLGSAAAAAPPPRVDPIAVDGTQIVNSRPTPDKPTAAEAAAAVAASATTEAQCFGDDNTLVLELASNDPDHPGTQMVVFFRETSASSTGNATLWVAWDFLDSEVHDNTITCDQLEYLQSQMDSIVATDVHYFGDYVQRPAGNENIDVMIYDIVDQAFFDPNAPFYIAGFFSTGPQEQFNRNMVFIDSYNWEDRLGADARNPYLYEGTVAHELEHLIHHDHDAGEESWIDEGMADLAEFLNGYGHPDSHVVYYLAFHRNGLTIWGGGLEDYGAAYLFQLYLLENFGSQTDGVWDNGWTRTLIDEPGHGIAGVENTTGAEFDDLFDAWLLANYFDDPSMSGAGGFPLGYDNIDLRPYHSNRFGDWSIDRGITQIYGAGHHGNLPIDRYFGGFQSGTVEFPVGALEPYAGLFGSYNGFEPSMNIFIRGEAGSGVAPIEGNMEMASGGGHLLTDRMLELNVPVGGTLDFKTWFDIEEEWDYAFVEASTDGGATWEKLAGNITRTSDNPNRSTAWANALGSATTSDTVITGSSMDLDTVDGTADGWVQGTFTLPAAANVMVRFSYFTDEAVNGKGWFIDDVMVNGFSDGFEAGTGDWTTDGWTHTTGLFTNDWMAAFVNPVYNRGKLVQEEWGYLDGTISGANEVITGVLDTSRLNRDGAVLVFWNRPGDSPFESAYLFLISKGNASQ